MLSYLFLLFHLLFALLVLFLVLAFVTGAPYVPSTDPVSHAMIRFARLKKGKKIYDLGSGDGKLLFLAANEGADATGFEINPFLVLLTFFKSLRSPYKKHIHCQWKNFWTAPFSDADVVFVYLLPWRMETLEKKLMKECKKETRIISNSFIFPHLKKIQADEKNHVYVFRI